MIHTRLLFKFYKYLSGGHIHFQARVAMQKIIECNADASLIRPPHKTYFHSFTLCKFYAWGIVETSINNVMYRLGCNRQTWFTIVQKDYASVAQNEMNKQLRTIYWQKQVHYCLLIAWRSAGELPATIAKKWNWYGYKDKWYSQNLCSLTKLNCSIEKC